MARLSQLARQEHLVDDRVDLVEVEDQIQLAYIVEVLVENLDKVMDGLQVKKVVVSYIDAYAEVESGVTAVDDLVVAELDKIRVLGISDCNENSEAAEYPTRTFA